jgi:hypothetical protein
MEELRAAVEPNFIRTLPTRDEWGTAFLYELDPQVGYRVVSAGSDAKFDRAAWSSGGLTTSFADDAVANGDRAGCFRSWDVK